MFSSCGSNTVVEMPTPANFSIESFVVQEGSDDKSIFLSLRLDKISDEKVSVFVETEDETATAGEDYVEISGKLVEFQPGSVQENLQVQIIGDEEAEGDETFKVKVVDITGANASISEAIVTIENDDISTEFNIPNQGYSTPESYTGYDLIWSDEFDGSALDENFWTYEIGNGTWGWGNNELQYYRRENTILHEGNLVIQAREENFSGFKYTSSRLITRGKFDFKHGRVDIRAALPEGQGIWPALWMLGANFNTVGWPRCGEIDIMEIVGHEPSKTHGTVHYANSNGDHIQNGSSTSLSGGEKFSQEFHVFSIVWSEEGIDWLLDDVKFHTVNRQSLGIQNPYPFDESFFFIFNVAVGGNWPGSPDATTSFPQNMIVDYIRVFQPE